MKLLTFLKRLLRIDFILATKIYLLLYYAKWLIEYRHLKEILAWVNRSDLAQKEVSKKELEIARKVSRYTLILAKLVPFESKCYDKALTVKKILNLQNIPSVLNMGVKTSNIELMKAHAWIQIENYSIIGGEVAPEYVLVQSFY